MEEINVQPPVSSHVEILDSLIVFIYLPLGPLNGVALILL